MTFRLEGLIAATHTPFGADGRLDTSRVAAQADHLASTGVAGVFIGGSTGEGLSMSVDERRALAEAWAEALGGRMRFVVHAGHNALPDAIALATHAREVGADAVAVMAPCYFRPPTVEALVAFCEPVAAAAGDLPFYFYDIPALTGVELSMPAFLRDGARRMPNLAGIKYTNADLMQLQQCRDVDEGRFDILFGNDEVLLAGLALGCRGAVGSSYNFAAPLYRRIIDAFDAGDLDRARREQARSVALVETLARHGYLGAAKAVMGLIGVDCGSARAPVTSPDAATVARIREDLESIGFFTWSR